MLKIPLIIFCITAMTSVGFAVPKRILIIRHAEKDPQTDDLSDRGYQRAEALKQIFKKDPSLAEFGLPSSIFAAAYSPGDSSNRSVETITPLADTLKLEVQTPFLGSHPKKMANEILNNPDLDRQIVMIAWTHQNIPKLAAELGSTPVDVWADDIYDRVWVLDFDKEGRVTSQNLPQKLLPGDSTH